MNKFVLITGAAALTVCSSAWAGPYNIPNSFSNGSTADADEVNANFTAAKTAIDDNNTRITALEADACETGMVRAGNICVDVYENSLWTASTGGSIIATTAVTDVPCLNNGSDCHNTIFARSVSGVQPAEYLTWFQAAAACANVGKRLLTNAEWQVAVMGTDPADDDSMCNTNGGIQNTGVSGANCRSDWGVEDGPGNVREWVADWIQGDDGGTLVSTSAGAGTDYGDDTQAGVATASNQDIAADGVATTANMPAAVYRGGGAGGGAGSGAFFFAANATPSFGRDELGFRCAK